jgi:hypothetical protein
VQFNIIKSLFTSFVIKEMCLRNPYKLSVETWGSMEHSLNTTNYKEQSTLYLKDQLVHNYFKTSQTH